MAKSSVSRLKRKGFGPHRTTWGVRVIPPRTRQALLSGASVAVVAAALIASPGTGFAADECGVTGAGGTATCTAAGNDYNDGITYAVDDLTIVLESNVKIDTDAGSEPGVSTNAAGNLSVQGTGGSSITTKGDFSYGVQADSSDGTVTVGVTDVVTEGDFAHGVYAYSSGAGADGAVSVTATGVVKTSGYYAHGVLAASDDGPVTVNVNDVDTSDDYSNGVWALSGGSGANGVVSVTATGQITTDGAHAEGVLVSSAGGAVTVTVVDVSTFGFESEGINAASSGSGADGAVSVTSTGTIFTNGDYAEGVRAFSSGGTVTVNVNDVTTNGDGSAGVWTESGGTGLNGAVSVTATGMIQTHGSNADGVYGYSEYGSVTVSVVDVDTAGSNAEGVNAFSKYGSVSVASTGTISTYGSYAEGVSAFSKEGSVTVSVVNVDTVGYESEGVDAFSKYGPVSVTATGTITTQGNYAEGVLARSDDDNVTVSVNNVTTYGDHAEGVEARSFGSGTVSVTATGTIDTDGDYAEGVFATSSSGNVTVSVNNVDTYGDFSDGVFARSYGSGTVSVTATGTIDTYGNNAEGVYARSSSGNVTVSVNNVYTDGVNSEGVEARSNGAGTVSVTSTGTIDTEGTGAEGVFAYSKSGPVTVSVKNVDTSGADSEGVEAISYGAGVNGAVSVTVSGDLYTSGAGSEGIWVRGASSNIVITSTGSVESDQDYSIFSYGSTTDTVKVYGDLIGTTQLNLGDDSVTFFSTADISQLGTTDAGGHTVGDALVFDGLAADIADTSIFVNFETVTFTNGADMTIDYGNNGTYTLNGPDGIFISNGSTLKIGGDEILNGDVTIDGTSTLIANGSSPAYNTIIGDLNLAGTLDLTDGDPDDETHVTDNLNGSGGVIALDVSFGPSGPAASDLVSVEDDSTGTVYISVNPVATGDGYGGPPLLTIGGSLGATVELLGGPLGVDGLVYDLYESGGEYRLLPTGAVTPDVAGAMGLAAAFAPINRDLFADLGTRIGTGDALRRPGHDKGKTRGIWGRAQASYHDGEAKSLVDDLDFDYTGYVVQLGADVFGSKSQKGGGFVASIMGNYQKGDGDIEQPGGEGTTLDVKTYGVGLGGTWYSPSREYYVDVTGMMNWHDVETAGQTVDAMSYMAGIEGGARWTGSNKVAMGVMGQLVYSSTDIDDLKADSMVAGSSKISLDNVDSLEAKAGFLWEYGAGTGTTIQLNANLTYEFLNDAEVSFGNGLTVEDDKSGLNGELGLRAATVVGGNISLFGEVKGRTSLGSGDATSVSGQLGARIGF